jgi:hypothetical protein
MTISFVSASDVGIHIISNPAPVLFLDTCIFLDILRASYREDVSVNAISVAISLIKISKENPAKVWLLTNELVSREWNDNINTVQQDLEKGIKKEELIREKLIKASDVIFNAEYVYGHKISSLCLSSQLRQLSLDLLHSCLIIKEEDKHTVSGMRRLYKHLYPSRQGKAEAKDCVIFETFLDIAKDIRNRGYDKKIYFVTSNSNDYGKPNNPLVSNDLNQINAELLNSLEWALSIVRK